MNTVDILMAGLFCLMTGLFLVAAIMGLDPRPGLMWLLTGLMFSGAVGYIRLASQGDQS